MIKAWRRCKKYAYPFKILQGKAAIVKEEKIKENARGMRTGSGGSVKVHGHVLNICIHTSPEQPELRNMRSGKREHLSAVIRLV